MDMMKRIIVVAAMLLLLAALFGCGNSARVAAPPEQNVSVAETIDGVVFLDGSMSMQGFVNFPAATEYVDAIKNIEQALTLGWKNENLAYYRFGDRLQHIDDEDRLRFAGYGFYGDLQTRLDVMVNDSDKEKLNFIVSDFLQTDQDFQKLVTAVKKNYFANGKGAALIGVKGRFKGAVYDIGLAKEQFYYYSGDDKGRFRPFYILVLGEQREVERFCRYYDQALAKDIDRKVICLTDDLGGGKLEAEAVDYSKLDSIKTYAAVDDILAAGSAVPQYTLKSRPGSVYLRYDLTQGSPMVDDVQIKTALELWQEQQQGFKKMMAVTAAKAEADVRSDGFAVRIDFRPEVLPESGVYRFGLFLKPDMDSYKTMQAGLLDDWTMEDSFEISSGGVFQIDTTLELKKFIRNLSEVAYVSLHPHYKERYVYFRY